MRRPHVGSRACDRVCATRSCERTRRKAEIIRIYISPRANQFRRETPNYVEQFLRASNVRRYEVSIMKTFAENDVEKRREDCNVMTRSRLNVQERTPRDV